MLSIAYVSVATAPLAADEIAALLTQARANNERDGITGALLYHRERFIQIVEGDDEIVRERFATISTDPRHRSVQMMREKRILERQFPQWTMGFREVSDESVKQLAGFEDFFRAEWTAAHRARRERSPAVSRVAGRVLAAARLISA